MIEPQYQAEIGDYLEQNKARYKSTLHRFRNGKLGLTAKIWLLVEMGYTVILRGDTIKVTNDGIETLNNY